MLRCDLRDKPEGVISQRTGEYYQVDTWPLFPVETDCAGVISIVEIDKEEYDRLTERLNEGAIPDDGSLDEESPEPGEEEVKLTTAQLIMRKIEKLEEDNALLREQNELLTECLLEMSADVYS